MVPKSNTKSWKKHGRLGEHPSGEFQGKELKWRVRALSTDLPSIGLANVYRNLTTLGTGTDYYQRVGRRVTIHYVDLFGTLVGGQTNSVADDPYNTVKIAVVLAVPTFAPSTEWSVAAPIGPQQVPGIRQVLWSGTVVINTNAKDSTGYIANGKLFMKRIVVNKTFEYTGSTDSVSSSDGLFVVACSDSVAVANPGFNSGFSLVCFTDS